MGILDHDSEWFDAPCCCWLESTDSLHKRSGMVIVRDGIIMYTVIPSILSLLVIHATSSQLIQEQTALMMVIDNHAVVLSVCMAVTKYTASPIVIVESAMLDAVVELVTSSDLQEDKSR